MKSGGVIIVIVLILILIGGAVSYFAFNKSDKGVSQTSATSSSENSNNEVTNQNANPATNSPSAKHYSVDISGFAFNPSTINVKVGDSVTWTNKDSASHTVTSDSGNYLDSELLSQGESYTKTFDSKGTYNYHCTPHPGMKGKVVVE